MSSYILGKMLASSGRLFEFMIRDFEKATGNSSIDLGLLGDVTAKTSFHLRKLKLSPADTLPEELVEALMVQLKTDIKKVDHQVVGQNEDLAFFNIQLVRLLNDILDQKVYRLSDKALIRLAKFCPPETTMKRLKFKSVDELIRRFNIAELMTVAWVQEKATWREQIVAEIAKMEAQDYEIKEIYFVALDPDLERIYKSSDNFIRNSLVGTILFKPYQTKLEFGILDGLVRGLNASKRMIDESNQLQIMSLSSDYPALITDWLLYQENIAWQLNGIILPWRSVYRAMAEPGPLNEALLEAYPGVELVRLDVSDEIAEQFATLDFWADTDYLAFRHKDQMVSLSLLDLLDPEYKQFKYGSRHHFEEALWDELLRLYLSQTRMVTRIMLFLKSNVIKK